MYPTAQIVNSIVILRTREQIAMQPSLQHLKLIISPDKKYEASYLSQAFYVIITSSLTPTTCFKGRLSKSMVQLEGVAKESQFC